MSRRKGRCIYLNDVQFSFSKVAIALAILFVSLMYKAFGVLALSWGATLIPPLLLVFLCLLELRYMCKKESGYDSH